MRFSQLRNFQVIRFLHGSLQLLPLVLIFSSDNCTKSNWGMHEGSYIPLSILYNSIISPRYLLYFNVGRFNTFNLSMCNLFDSPGINFVALLCTRSNLSTSVFLLGYQTLFAYSRWDLTSDLYKIMKRLWEILGMLNDYRILVLCVAHSRPTDAAVTLCARQYIAAARERTPDVWNGIRGIGSADGMRSL